MAVLNQLIVAYFFLSVLSQVTSFGFTVNFTPTMILHINNVTKSVNFHLLAFKK